MPESGNFRYSFSVSRGQEGRELGEHFFALKDDEQAFALLLSRCWRLTIPHKTVEHSFIHS